MSFIASFSVPLLFVIHFTIPAVGFSSPQASKDSFGAFYIYVCTSRGGNATPLPAHATGPGSVRLCNAMETELPHSPSLPHPAS